MPKELTSAEFSLTRERMIELLNEDLAGDLNARLTPLSKQVGLDPIGAARVGE